MEIRESLKSSKIYIDGTEYMRVDGVWFEYNIITEEYQVIDRPDFEELYKETINHD